MNKPNPPIKPELWQDKYLNKTKHPQQFRNKTISNISNYSPSKTLREILDGDLPDGIDLLDLEFDFQITRGDDEYEDGYLNLTISCNSGTPTEEELSEYSLAHTKRESEIQKSFAEDTRKYNEDMVRYNRDLANYEMEIAQAVKEKADREFDRAKSALAKALGK